MGASSVSDISDFDRMYRNRIPKNRQYPEAGIPSIFHAILAQLSFLDSIAEKSPIVLIPVGTEQESLRIPVWINMCKNDRTASEKKHKQSKKMDGRFSGQKIPRIEQGITQKNGIRWRMQK